jgi:dipeptidyl aminopeptidase/acylaminoacyl peptidase
LETGDLKRLAEGAESIESWVVGAHHNVVARSTYDETNGNWRILTDSRAGRVLASGNSTYGGVQIVAGQAPDKIIARVPTRNGLIDKEIALVGGDIAEIPNNDNIGDLLFDRTSDLWIGFTTIGDMPEERLFNPLFEARVKGARKAFPGLSSRVVSWSSDFSRMIVFTSGEGDSGTYWLVDIASGKAHAVGSEYPEVSQSDVGPIQMVSWKAEDGTAIQGVLSLPPGRDPKSLPVVVLPHGGPEARDYPVFDWWAQAFASRGYAVLQPNFRGSSGYGSAFRDAGFGQWGRKMQTDLSDGLASLAKAGVVDPKRACIVGASYGGYAALAGVTVQHGLYRCAVSVAGVSDPRAMIQYALEKQLGANSATRYWHAFIGSPAGYSEISPLMRASFADAPILLIHGVDDTVVPFGQSVALERALRGVNKSVEFVRLPAEDHWLSREATRTAMLESALIFVEKYNPSAAPN